MVESTEAAPSLVTDHLVRRFVELNPLQQNAVLNHTSLYRNLLEEGVFPETDDRRINSLVSLKLTHRVNGLLVLLFENRVYTKFRNGDYKTN